MNIDQRPVTMATDHRPFLVIFEQSPISQTIGHGFKFYNFRLPWQLQNSAGNLGHSAINRKSEPFLPHLVTFSNEIKMRTMLTSTPRPSWLTHQLGICCRCMQMCVLATNYDEMLIFVYTDMDDDRFESRQADTHSL